MRYFILYGLAAVSILAMQACTSASESVAANESHVDIPSGKYLRVQFRSGVEITSDEKLPIVGKLTDTNTYDKNGINTNNIVLKNCSLVMNSQMDVSSSRIILSASKITCQMDNKIKDFTVTGYVTDDNFVLGLKISNKKSKRELTYFMPSGKTAYFFLTNNLSISI